MDNVHINTHPIVCDRLTRLRNQATRPRNFRQYLNDIAFFLAVDATRDLPLVPKTVETPLGEADGDLLDDASSPLIVPILRAGLALAGAFERLCPDADTGHIGLYRDHDTHEPVEYLVRLPSRLDRPVFIVDPMLATGHSMIAALDCLAAHGAPVDKIRIVTLLCAPEGIRALRARYPSVPVFTAAIDDRLNEQAYIVPGLGDAGDRYFGTL